MIPEIVISDRSTTDCVRMAYTEVAPPRCGSCTPHAGHTNHDDVEWPCDLKINCAVAAEEITPDYLEATLVGSARLCARPELVREGCGQIAVDYEDQVVRRVDSACMKILRTWTIIDWCQFEIIRRGDSRYAQAQAESICYTHYDSEERCVLLWLVDVSAGDQSE